MVFFKNLKALFTDELVTKDEFVSSKTVISTINKMLYEICQEETNEQNNNIINSELENNK